jgi:dethiobiotin synthetase
MPTRNTVLVTGTDTGVGKTWTACALAGALRQAGRTVVAIKPIETGCDDASADHEDGVRLAAATGQAHPRRALRRFRAPVAPAIAADVEGGSLDLDELATEIDVPSSHADVLLLEGAGGLLAPLAWDWTAMDLARLFEASALVVASDRLGTINHTLLTLSALDLAGIRVAGIVLTTPASPDASTGNNAGAIARLSGIERVRVAPRIDDPANAVTSLVEVAGWL